MCSSDSVTVDYSLLKTEYFGVKVEFTAGRQHFLSAYEFISLLQKYFMANDVVRAKRNIHSPPTEPIRCVNISQWLMVQEWIPGAKPTPQGEKATSIKAKNLPSLIINCGGRKIRIPRGGNRYAYDMGEFPEGSLKNSEIMTNPDTFGKNPIHSTFANISYPDIKRKVCTSIGMDEKNAECIFRLLRGEQLPSGFSDHLPVLTCALFASEVARNPVSMISTLLLLELIQTGADVPFHHNTKFTFDNCLWDKDAPEGGFFPMCHKGSMKNEFVSSDSSDAPYLLNNPLQKAHFKSFVIIVEWCKKYLNISVVEVNEDALKRGKEQELNALFLESQFDGVNYIAKVFEVMNRLIGETIVNTLVESSVVSRFCSRAAGAGVVPTVVHREGTIHSTGDGFIRYSLASSVLPHWSVAQNRVFNRYDYDIDYDDEKYDDEVPELDLASGIMQFGDLAIPWCAPKIPGTDCAQFERCTHGRNEADCAYHGALLEACRANDLARVQLLHKHGCGLTSAAAGIVEQTGSTEISNFFAVHFER